MTLAGLYASLLHRYGPQGWWPAGTRFEMAVGALLVQNTRWKNAALALEALAGRGWLDSAAMARAPLDELRHAIRPAGFWRQKASRLKDLARWIEAQGGFDALGRLPTPLLRARLLERPGIGPETADCILVYAFARPVFIADACARRVLERTGMLRAAGVPGRYEAVRGWAESGLPARPEVMNECHALLVAHAKAHCAATPRCRGCVLSRRCETGRRLTARRRSSR